MSRAWFAIRWSARDLRRRWLQVVVIALIIAVGTGVYAGLGSTSRWRERSYDDSYALLHMHDLRVELNEGSRVPAGHLIDALEQMDHPAWIMDAEERLIAPTQLDASTQSAAVLVPGRVVGVDVSEGGPHVDGIDVTRGRALSAEDAGREVALLEAHFADHYGLPRAGELELAGGVPLRYVGTGYSPEYFMVVDESGGLGLMAEANLGVVFMPLTTAQALTGNEGAVNDLVISLSPGIDPDRARPEIEAALSERFPEVGITVTTREEDPAYRLLYGDLESDQGTFRMLAFLMFVAAVFAAFNLTSRIVEAQRRELGIGMALGVRRRALAVRPLLVGAEIALLGVLFGIGMGMLVGVAMRSVLQDLMPLPVWETPFQPGEFAAAAALGFVLPLLATAWPVWRAVRVRPVDAIKTGHLAARGGGLAPLLKRLPVPGGSFGQIPIRNVLRAPRRTILTAIGVGVSIMMMVAILGMLDSFAATIDRGEEEILRGSPDRMSVDLAGFVPVDSRLVHSVVSSPAIEQAEPMVRVGGRVEHDGMAFDLLIEVLDLQNPVWHPAVRSPAPADGLPGIVLARKAIEDLGVAAGERVVVLHPVRTGADAFALARTRMTVVGVHDNPMRPFAYIDTAGAGLMGLTGATNTIQVTPAEGYSVGEVKRALFDLPGVASVQPVNATTHALRDLIDRFASVFRVIELFALGLALLVAFNAASINVDERAREHATMFAFGMRLRTLLRMTSVEGFMVGLLGTLAGVGFGALALGRLMANATREAPEVRIDVELAAGTVVLALAIGLAAALIAPLLTARRLGRMDIPSTLRVME